MVFTKFVQIGRVVLVNSGEDAGKLAVIVNVVSLGRVQIEGPYEVTGVKRQVVSTKSLNLTDLVVKISVGARAGTVAKALKSEGVLEKFAASKTGKLLAIKKARADTTDFDRFKIMVARKTKARAIHTKLAALRKSAKA